MLDAMHTGFKICFQSKTSLSCFSVGIHDLKKQKKKNHPVMLGPFVSCLIAQPWLETETFILEMCFISSFL